MRQVQLKSVFWKIVVTIAALLFARYCLQIFVFASFRVPSDSMYPAIESSQRIVVNKLAYGPRIFNYMDTIMHGSICRIKGFSIPQRNDIIAFNNPYSHEKEHIRFDVMQYMVKRIVALPGDTFEITNCRYRVRNCTDSLGYIPSQKNLAKIVLDTILVACYGIETKTFPNSSSYDWTISDFGPLDIPRKGDTLSLSGDNRVLYRQLVEWESGSEYAEDQHIVEQNYYFVVGDNCLISYDSRYWGLVPEEFIVGRVDWIL